MSTFAIRLVLRCIYDSRKCLFYCYDAKQAEGSVDPHVTVYSVWNDIPKSYRRLIAPNPRCNVMVGRMRRKQAKLLCYSCDRQSLNAYGWIQDWKPFRRRFGEIAQQGSMLGPYWTAPESRRQGLYSRLLAHSVALCYKERPIIIYTSPENIASQHGIKKAGFTSMGEWEAKRWLGMISRLRRMSV